MELCWAVAAHWWTCGQHAALVSSWQRSVTGWCAEGCAATASAAVPHRTLADCPDRLACLPPPPLQVRAGTGGEEAALWAADLIRMYQKYADAQVRCCHVDCFSQQVGQAAAVPPAPPPAVAGTCQLGPRRPALPAPCQLSGPASHRLTFPPTHPQGWKVGLMSESVAEAGGYKECVLEIKGDR